LKIKELPPPSKSFGQNYLTNKGVIQKIINSLNLKPGDTIVEIGPGRGALTNLLSSYSDILVKGIEIHKPTIEYLKDHFKDKKNVEIIQGDAQKFDYSIYKNVKIVGNLPYNVGSRILFRLIETSINSSEFWVLMFQKEVAQRIVSNPGKKSFGSLSVISQLSTKPSILFNVNPGSFYPAPKVDSSIVKFLPSTDFNLENFPSLKNYLKQIFSQRRKKIRKVLIGIVGVEIALKSLEKAGINENLRPDVITPEQFQLLINYILQYKMERIK
jgi:16S rRNA (adenine1518-N6/adenine1519-N6)-dimethyltransferase